MSTTRLDLRVILSVGLLAVCGAALPGDFAIDWHTIDGGGAMANTGNAVVVGNAIYDDSAEALREIVSFVGQVPVRVHGAVALGDYIVALGMNDGTAIAVSPHDIAPQQGRLIVGRAREASDEQGVKLINTVVGLPESASTTAALARTVSEQQEQIDELRDTNARLQRELEDLRSTVADFASLARRLEAIEASMSPANILSPGK